MQRRLAREVVQANAEDKQLEVYTKESSYADLPGLVYEADMPGPVVESEECDSPEGPGGDEEPKAEGEDQDFNTFGKLIIDKIWDKFKELNPSCQEERGSAFLQRW